MELAGPADDVGVIRIEFERALELIGRTIVLVAVQAQGARDAVAFRVVLVQFDAALARRKTFLPVLRVPGPLA